MPIPRTHVAAVALIATFVVGVSQSAPASTLDAAGSCPVTLPAHVAKQDAGFAPAGFNYGNKRLRVQVWPHGTLMAGILPNGASWATIDPDGSISAKQGWWVGVPGKFVITGRRLDAAAPPLRAWIPEGYGLGFQPAGLTFPTAGCWRVSGKVGSARLTFVVRVTKLKASAG